MKLNTKSGAIKRYSIFPTKLQQTTTIRIDTTLGIIASTILKGSIQFATIGAECKSCRLIVFVSAIVGFKYCISLTSLSTDGINTYGISTIFCQIDVLVSATIPYNLIWRVLESSKLGRYSGVRSIVKVKNEHLKQLL